MATFRRTHNGREIVVVTDAVRHICKDPQDIGKKREDYSDTVGDEHIFRLVDVDVYGSRDGDVNGLEGREHRIGEETKSDICGEFWNENIESAISGECHVLDALGGEGLGNVVVGEEVIFDKKGVQV